MVSQNIVHVAIAPPDKPETGLVTKVAGVIRKDVYGTRLLLAGKMPKIIAHYRSTAEAESVARSLKDLGLVAFVCDDVQLRSPPLKIFNATSIKIGEDEVVFSNQNGETRKIGTADVFLLLKGKRQTYTETEESTTKLKFSVGKTMLTGGIPIWNKVKEKTTNKSLQIGLFLRVYDRTAAEPKIEVPQQGVDYSFLGQNLAFSSLANFDTTVSKIRDVFPQAIFDDKLMQLPAPEIAPITSGIDIEVNCKLLYFYYLALQEKSTH